MEKKDTLDDNLMNEAITAFNVCKFNEAVTLFKSISINTKNPLLAVRAARWECRSHVMLNSLTNALETIDKAQAALITDEGSASALSLRIERGNALLVFR